MDKAAKKSASDETNISQLVTEINSLKAAKQALSSETTAVVDELRAEVRVHGLALQERPAFPCIFCSSPAVH